MQPLDGTTRTPNQTPAVHWPCMGVVPRPVHTDHVLLRAGVILLRSSRVQQLLEDLDQSFGCFGMGSCHCCSSWPLQQDLERTEFVNERFQRS